MEARMNHVVGDIMTPNPRTVEATRSVQEAAAIMRDAGIGALVVLRDDQVHGILTDRDIVVRALAQERDPARTPVGEICSRELTTVRPTDPVEQATRLMRDKAVRRLPVVGEAGAVVGIVSLGDLAQERDPESVLGQISAAPPNA
jgi:CBS domain-containing protein